jgi:hypothetical protein
MQDMGGGRSSGSTGNIVSVLYGLAAGPAGWILQLTLSYGVASYACFPRVSPWRQSPPPGWAAEPIVLALISLTCLAITASGVFVSVQRWRARRTRREGFLTACGIMASAGFTLALLFDAWPILRMPACWIVLR